MQTKIPGIVPAIHLFALFQLLEFFAGLCPSSRAVSEVA
jgi:hypothetical protein